MQVYNIPYNFNHEEKIFGGYVSLRQAIYLIVGLTSAAIFFIPFIDIFIKTMIFLIIGTLFILFAFLKLDETNADKYFIYVLNFIFRKKKYILEKGRKEK